jgi:surfactin synthase thioesterase subunit
MRCSVVLRASLLIAAALAMGGCWSRSVRGPFVQGEQPGVLELAQGSELIPGLSPAWPARDASLCADLVARTPREIRPFALREGVPPEQVSDDDRARLNEVSHVVHYAGLHAGGALRLFDVQFSSRERARGWAPSESDLRAFYGFLPSGSFVTSRGLTHRENREYRESGRQFIARLNEREGQRAIVRTGQGFELAMDSGMAVRAPLPSASIDPQRVRGLVVHLAALAGNPFEPPVIDALERDGWVVVSLDTIAGVPTPRNTSARAQRNSERAELRTIDDELRTLPGTLGNRPEHARARELARRRERVVASLRALEKSEALRSFEICDASQADEVGTTIAREIDESLASNAYCAQALVEYICSAFPQLDGKPLVLLGFSAGALAAPTAAVRLQELGVPVSAMVLVGGGADLFSVATKSELTDGGIRLRCTRGEGAPQEPGEATAQAVHDAYLRASQLDPLKLAPRLAHVPTLMLHASWDTWVPASTGDALWEALGKPDRWTLMLGGHGMLFYLLPTQARNITGWISQRAAPSEKPPSR